MEPKDQYLYLAVAGSSGKLTLLHSSLTEWVKVSYAKSATVLTGDS